MTGVVQRTQSLDLPKLCSTTIVEKLMQCRMLTARLLACTRGCTIALQQAMCHAKQQVASCQMAAAHMGWQTHP